MKVTDLNTAKQFKDLAKLIEKAEELEFEISESTGAGYNEYSGVVYLYDLDAEWGYFSLAAIYNHRVEVVMTEPFEGNEFWGRSPQEAYEEYKEWAAEALANDEICEDDVINLNL